MKSSFRLLSALLVALLWACNQSAPGDSHADVSPFHCAGCHTPEFNSTARPPHAGARPETCGVCHSQGSWGHARIEHPWWALTGAHARAAQDKTLAGVEKRVKCFWCHRGEPAQFAGTPRDCVGCHADDRQGVKFPGHDGFSTSCQNCHSTEAWKPAEHPVAVPLPPTPSPSSIAPPPKTKRTPRAVPIPTRTPVAMPTTPPTTPPTPPRTAPTPDITSHASRHR